MLWLLACQPGPPAEPPAPPAPQPVLWRLSGRKSTAQTTADAPPFAGATELLSRCDGARPCSAEQWRASDGATATVLRRGDRLEWAEGDWPATWMRLGTELTHCLDGDPLASPPGRDPGGFRVLSARTPPGGDREAQWVLHFSGENTCQLSGELLLSGQRDRADSRALFSGELRWDEGGRANALAILRAHYEDLEALNAEPK